MIPRSLCSFLKVSLAIGVASFLGVSAQAQRAPELLPANSVLVAGGGSALVGGKCPVSGNTATDSYGDGCLATEIQIGNTATGGNTPGARFAVADVNGNVFFSDYNNGLIRRVDAVTGIVTAVAGGAATTPGLGTVCGTLVSTDALGDGCLGTAVKLTLHPMGLAFAPNGDLYFSESDFSTSATGGGAHIRKISATGGFITTTGVISLVLGQPTAKGYAANVSTTCTQTLATGCVIPATSYLFSPYGLSTDKAGNLYIAEEYSKNAVLVYNPTLTYETINGVAVPAGTVAKISGASGSTTQDCPNSPASTNGCTFGKSVFGAKAWQTINDGIYQAAPDSLGNVFEADEYYNFIGQIATDGTLTELAGTQGTGAKNITRAKAGTNPIGSVIGIATDANNNVYFTDASSAVVWRIDADTQTQYIVAGAGTPCAAAIDSYGDGCPSLQSTFGTSIAATSSSSYASVTLPGPGIYGVSVDAYGNLFTGDTETNLVREIATGAQFGAIGNTQPTNTLLIHYAPSDGPASSSPYVLTSGGNNFTLGTPGTCISNADGSKDCPLPLTANPPVLGAFTGTLKVTSSAGKTASFPLSGTFVASPITRLSVTATAPTSCSGSTIYPTTATIALTATIASTGSPSGTVQFYDNGTAIGSPVAVSNSVATYSATFAAGSHSITAKYNSTDAYYQSSSTTRAAAFSTSAPTFGLTTTSVSSPTVAAGGTALYSFTVNSNLYAGNVSFACSGLPAGASCVFSPATISATQCGTTNTVALSIFTTQAQPIKAGGFGAGRGRWNVIATLTGLLLAVGVGLRRRRMQPWLRAVSMMAAAMVAASGLVACSSNVVPSGATPSGTYGVTVTATGSPAAAVPTGSSQSVVFSLTVK